MNYKKILTLILAMLMIFSVSACGDNVTQTSLHPTISKPGSDASADLSLPESVKLEAVAEDTCIHELVVDEYTAKAQVESCFDIKLSEMTKVRNGNFITYTNAECEVMYDEECGYWTYDVLNRKSPKSGMSMSDEEALKIAKDFVEENELWPEEISNVKTVDQYGLNEDLEYGVDTKSVYFYPQVDGKTVLGRFRISIDVDLTGEIVSVKYMVTPLGESISASLKSRADIAADVKAGDYSASFTQDLSDAQISRCEYGYYADGVAHDGKTYLYPVYILSGEGKTADGSTETFDLIIDAQK